MCMLVSVILVVWYCSGNAICETVNNETENGLLWGSNTGNGTGLNQTNLGILYEDPHKTELYSRGTTKYPVTGTQFGLVRGRHTMATENGVDMHFDEYLGIPYAKPPIGEMRFGPPRLQDSWNGIKNTTEVPPMCMQRINIYSSNVSMSEDCLYLNVYVPKFPMSPKEKLAVMVFIHGGGYTAGSSALYIGNYLAWNGRTIVVTMNYRLGAFGFLSTGDSTVRGNMGLLDQHMAMLWVKKNIEYFGGDDSRLTLFGESAGGGSVVAHLLSPMSKELFHRAIVQSPWFFGIAGRMNPKRETFHLAESLHCPTSSSKNMIECLRRASAKDITEIGLANPTDLNGYGPTGDGIFISGEPTEMITVASNIHKKEIIWSTNHDEGAIYAFPTMLAITNNTRFLRRGITLKQFTEQVDKYIGIRFPQNREAVNAAVKHQYIDQNKQTNGVAVLKGLFQAIGDFVFLAPAVRMANQHSTMAPSYFYHFVHRLSFQGLTFNNVTYPGLVKPKWWKADHGDDIAFVFGTEGFGTRGFHLDEAEKKMQAKMQQFLGYFARFGNPNGIGDLVVWPQFKKDARNPYLEIDEGFTIQHLSPKMKKRISFWIEVIPRIGNTSAAPPTSSNKVSSGFRSSTEHVLPIIMLCLFSRIMF